MPIEQIELTEVAEDFAPNKEDDFLFVHDTSSGTLKKATLASMLGQASVEDLSDGTSVLAAKAEESDLDLKQDIARTVVTSATVSVSPTAADSGKIYRLTHAAPTFNLPTTGLIAGTTHFFISCTSNFAVNAGANVIESLSWTGGFAANSANVVLMFGGQYVTVQYVASGVWAISGIEAAE